MSMCVPLCMQSVKIVHLGGRQLGDVGKALPLSLLQLVKPRVFWIVISQPTDFFGAIWQMAPVLLRPTFFVWTWAATNWLLEFKCWWQSVFIHFSIVHEHVEGFSMNQGVPRYSSCYHSAWSCVTIAKGWNMVLSIPRVQIRHKPCHFLSQTSIEALKCSPNAALIWRPSGHQSNPGKTLAC